jgi:hypothetical protein
MTHPSIQSCRAVHANFADYKKADSNSVARMFGPRFGLWRLDEYAVPIMLFVAACTALTGQAGALQSGLKMLDLKPGKPTISKLTNQFSEGSVRGPNNGLRTKLCKYTSTKIDNPDN